MVAMSSLLVDHRLPFCPLLIQSEEDVQRMVIPVTANTADKRGIIIALLR